MTSVQRFANGIRTGLEADRQRIVQASVTALPWSRESIDIRNRAQAEMLEDHVRRGERVLDVGCGSGYLSNCLQEMYAVEATGLDIRDFRTKPIAFQSFDGTSIPFPDKSFDHVLLSFTLHHSHDPMTLIRECHRVARRSIMAFEDLPQNRPGEMLVALHVDAYRLLYRTGTPRSAAYRAALDWLGEQAVNVVRTPMPYEWIDRIYVPRFLLVHKLSEE